jgi:beta-lactamase class A
VTNTLAWGPSIRKEVRALLPVWAATMIALLVAIGPLVRSGVGHYELVIYIIGAITLGAFSIGHEYLSGTLTSWLAQPVDRKRLLFAKLVVLAPALISIAGFAVFLRSISGRYPLFLNDVRLPLALAIGVAPWLTMVARGPLGGAVFTVASTVVIGGAQLFATGRLGVSLLWGFCAVGAALGWRMFMRLEAIDTARDLEFPRLGRDRPATRDVPSRFGALVGKELHLQQLTILCAALSFAVVVLANLARHALPVEWAGVAFPLSLLHAMLVPVLAGALASAEERRLGTLEGQVLQPVATWKQWAIKTAVVVGLSLLLGIGLIALLTIVDPSADVAGLQRSVSSARTLGVVAIPASSLAWLEVAVSLTALFVSSLAANGLRAIAASVVVLATAIAGAEALPPLLLNWRSMLDVRSASSSVTWAYEYIGAGHSAASERLLLASGAVIGSAVAIGFAILLLRLGLTNHRSAERGAGRAWRQGLAIAAYVVLAGVTAAAAAGISSTAASSRGIPIAIRLKLSASATRRARWNHDLAELTKNFDGRVGVCIDDGGSSACVRASDPFPMQSVMKLPVAIAALDAVDRGAWHLDDPVVVRKSDLSVFVQPIAKLVGPNGFKTTVDDLIRRAIVDSDNAAADVLIAKLGGASAVQLVLNRKEMHIRVDRDEKHLQSEINGLEWRPEYLDPAVFDQAIKAVPETKRDAAFAAYLSETRDTTSPISMVVLLFRLERGGALSKASTAHLLEILQQTATGADRLKAGVAEGWTLAHKTGTSGDWRGVTAATNDVGILSGPHGERVYVAVFIAESRAPEKDRAALMASIARLATTKY